MRKVGVPSTSRRIAGWTVTAHALLRMRQRDISREDLLAAISSPQITYRSVHRSGARLVLHGDGIRIVCDPVRRIIFTVMPIAGAKGGFLPPV